MKNKKQIPFNFELWEKEGISVDDIMGRLVIKLHENPIKDEFYGITHDGSTFALPVNKFIMYQEVKLREIWVNEFEGRICGRKYYISKEDARDNVGFIGTRQIKFIEVID